MASGHPDWTEAVLLKGRDPDGNLVVIAVDANGYLTVPLKGDYEGTLTTIMVDADGRITAYLVDNSDAWGEILKVGNAEQAARLGSPIAWDRRGDVLLVHTFENGYGQFDASVDGTGASVDLSPLHAWYGGLTCKLTGGSTGNKSALIQAGMGKPPSTRVGLAVRFSVDSLPAYLDLTLGVYESGTLSHGEIRYDFDNNRPQYYDDNETFQNLAVYKTRNLTYVSNLIKFVVDTSTGKYVRLLINEEQYDLTYDMYTAGGQSTGDHVYFSIKAVSHAGDNDEVFIDDVALTVNEP